MDKSKCELSLCVWVGWYEVGVRVSVGEYSLIPNNIHNNNNNNKKDWG